MKNYYQKNKKKEQEKSRRYRKDNEEKCREGLRNHYKNNKEQYLRKKDERKRKLKWIKVMDNPFPKEVGIEWHHLNDLLVIPIPRSIHKFHYTGERNNHREWCNEKIKLLGLWCSQETQLLCK